jgi:hypothetical protein
LLLQGGASNLNLQAGQITDNYEGIVFESNAGRQVFNVTLSHVSVMQANQHAVVFNAPGAGAVFAGVTVRLNFLLTGGFKSPGQASSGVLFRGSAPTLRRTQVIMQAIDPAQFLKITQFAAVLTRTTAPVSGFVFRSDCWNGGYHQPGAQVRGAFKNSVFQIFFGDSVGGSIFSFTPTSSNNSMTKMEQANREFSLLCCVALCSPVQADAPQLRAAPLRWKQSSCAVQPHMWMSFLSASCLLTPSPMLQLVVGSSWCQLPAHCSSSWVPTRAPLRSLRQWSLQAPVATR